MTPSPQPRQTKMMKVNDRILSGTFTDLDIISYIKDCPFDPVGKTTGFYRIPKTRVDYFESEIRSRPAPSPCEENGCTDTDNCDEICEHSRVYSPIQIEDAKKQAAAQARNDVLNEITEHLEPYGLKSKGGITLETIWTTGMIRAYIESLRTPKAVKEQ